MKTNEILDAFVASLGIDENEITSWYNSRQAASKLITFPMVEKVGNEFKPLSTADENWQSRVWGYELLPKVFLAKKCCPQNWHDSKREAESMVSDGKRGSLPSYKVLKRNWSEELRDKIKAMDKWLCENGVDAETKYYGVPWCSEVNNYGNAYYFYLFSGHEDWNLKGDASSRDRLGVAF